MHGAYQVAASPLGAILLVDINRRRVQAPASTPTTQTMAFKFESMSPDLSVYTASSTLHVRSSQAPSPVAPPVHQRAWAARVGEFLNTEFDASPEYRPRRHARQYCNVCAAVSSGGPTCSQPRPHAPLCVSWDAPTARLLSCSALLYPPAALGRSRGCVFACPMFMCVSDTDTPSWPSARAMRRRPRLGIGVHARLTCPERERSFASWLVALGHAVGTEFSVVVSGSGRTQGFEAMRVPA